MQTKNIKCRNCSAIITSERNSCPICYSPVSDSQKQIAGKLVGKYLGSDDALENDTGIISCLLNVSFDKFAVVVISKYLYTCCLIFCFLILFGGILFSINFHNDSASFIKGDTKSYFTTVFIAASIFIPLIILLFIRIVMEFAIAVIKTAENTNRILEIIKKI